MRRGAVIPFVRPPLLRRELNEQFALKHPQLSRSLTLSKIRAIKRELLSFAQEQDCELSTVALAHVYFEKLVLRNVVNKMNRKLMAAVCTSPGTSPAPPHAPPLYLSAHLLLNLPRSPARSRSCSRPSGTSPR